MPPLDRDGLLLAIGKAVVDHLRDGEATFVGTDMVSQDHLNADSIEKIMEQFGPLPGFSSEYQDKKDETFDVYGKPIALAVGPDNYGLPRRVIDGKPEDIKKEPGGV